MGVRFPSVFSNSIVGTIPSGAAEGVIVTTPPLTIPLDSAAVFIHWCISGNVGTGSTQFTVRCRRGTTISALAVMPGQDQITVTAGNQFTLAGCAIDTPGAVAGVQYSVTIAATGSTGVGGINDVEMIAYAL